MLLRISNRTMQVDLWRNGWQATTQVTGQVRSVGTQTDSAVVFVPASALGDYRPPVIPFATRRGQAGDTILSVGGTDVESWSDLTDALLAADGGRTSITVQRGDSVFTAPVSIPDSLVAAGRPYLGVGPFEEPVIGKVRRRSPADRAGLQAGDRIVRIGDRPVGQWGEVTEAIHDSPGKPLTG